MPDQCDDVIVGPVDVFQHDHERAEVGSSGQVPANGLEHRVPVGGAPVVVIGNSPTQPLAEVGHQPGELRRVAVDQARQFAVGTVARIGPQDLGDRQVGRPGLIVAAAQAHGRTFSQ